MVLPNTICIGAQRAATTWTYNCLKEHPEVFTPEKKELHFFDEQFDKGLAWYEDKFKGYNGQKAIVEMTPNYLDVEPAIDRIAATLPRARLFVILREPVDRALSAYQLFERFRDRSFPEALRSSRYLVDLGLYAHHLRRVYQYFPRERVKVFLYEDVQTDPAGFLRELFRYLEVDPTFEPASTRKVYNRIMFPRAQKLARQAGLVWLVRGIKKTPIGDWIKRRHADQKGQNGKVILDEKTVRDLRGIFRDDVLQLQELIGRDLSAWL
jgi:hypothetical protein